MTPTENGCVPAEIERQVDPTDEDIRHAEFIDRALLELAQEHNRMVLRVADLDRRLRYYESSVPAIHQARSNLDHAGRNGLILVPT